MKNYNEKFRDALNHMINVEGRCSQADLAAAVDMKQPSISSILNGRYGCKPANKLKIAEFFGMTLEEFLAYPDSIYKDEQPQDLKQSIREVMAEMDNTTNMVSFSSESVKRHFRIIQEFRDQETAADINSDLVKIEAMDTDEFQEIREMIKAKRRKLERKQKPVRLPKASNSL